MPVVWSARHRGHAPGRGYWLGVELPGDEEPSRGEALRDALHAAGARLRDPDDHGDAPVLAVHDEALVAFLASAHDRWITEGHLDDPGQPLVVPYVFALAALTPERAPHRPTAVRAEAGRFAIDTMTLIGPGTYDAARAAVDGALSAADEVLAGAPAAYAAIRPPGHHVARACYGGSCYLNNTACAVQHLHDRGVLRVAVVDIDAHHGNGTQEIFYDRDDVWFGSLHVDPGAGWFPHFCGFADERGRGRGEGSNVNVPLAEATTESEWLAALAALLDDCRRTAPDVVVVSLGVDTAREDPNSPFAMTAAGFARAGALLAALGRPTVFVQEGGYALDVFADHVVALLTAFEEAS
jgi:acetoin utilization deacetylase AcuC-like enzyme